MDVTLLVSHFDRSWLNAVLPRNTEGSVRRRSKEAACRQVRGTSLTRPETATAKWPSWTWNGQDAHWGRGALQQQRDFSRVSMDVRPLVSQHGIGPYELQQTSPTHASLAVARLASAIAE